jgi:hypothetical protein
MRTFMILAVLAMILTVMPTYAERGASIEHVRDSGRLIRLHVLAVTTPSVRG